MDTDGIAALIRSLVGGWTRRGLLAGAATSLLGALPNAFDQDVALAGSKRRRRRKKRKHRRKKKPATCAQRCPDTCAYCVTRVDGSTLCSGNVLSGCEAPCTSDLDCAGAITPYCTTGYTERKGPEADIFRPWACDNGNVSICTQINDC